MVQIASALEKAHLIGIIHRDLKPSNVMLCVGGQVKLLDFGLARMVVCPDRELGRHGDDGAPADPNALVEGVVGTVGYMSPEQAFCQPADHRSDIWGLGVILYEMLAARRAFRAESIFETIDLIRSGRPADLPNTTPAAVAELVWRCLEKEPERRFQSTGELVAALKEILAETNIAEATGSVHVPSFENVAPPRKRPSGAIALGALALGATLGWYHGHRLKK
jgi:serine/threonine protein kinase